MVSLSRVVFSLILATLPLESLCKTQDFRIYGSHYAKTWNIHNSETVALSIDSTERYRLLTSNGKFEYERLLPSKGHTIELDLKDGEGSIPYTIAMFHQMKCLHILREAYIKSESTEQADYCLNYLRQAILCSADSRLESVRSATGRYDVSWMGDDMCQDWTTVYDTVQALAT